MELEAVEFTEEQLDLPSVQKFNCGATIWGTQAANWLKAAPPFPGALSSMRRFRNRVWLYFLYVEVLGEKYLVGFSSLGRTRWPLAQPS